MTERSSRQIISRRDVKTIHPQIECVGTARAILGESVYWSEDENAVLWVDIVGRKILRTDFASGHTEEWRFEEQTGFVQPCEDGNWLVGQENSILKFDCRTGSSRIFLPLESDDPHTRTNDAACDPAGRLLVGTMRMPDFGLAPVGSLYRISGTSLEVIEHELTIPNGLAFDPSRNLVYWAETTSRQIWRASYNAQTGEMGPKERFAELTEAEGRPDGAAVDAEGCYWIAAARGWQLLRYTPDGEPDLMVRLPVQRPSKLAFGGPNLKTIFITTISEGVDLAEQPLAGNLLAINLDIAGTVPWLFQSSHLADG